MLISITLAAILHAAPPQALELCKKVTLKPGSEVVLKEAISPTGSKGVVACAYMDAPGDRVYAALTDYDSFPKWIDKVDKTETKWVEPTVAMVKYTLGTFFGDYIYTLRRVHVQDQSIEWVRTEGAFKEVAGRYDFLPSPSGAGSLFVTESFVDPGVAMPGFIEEYFRVKGLKRLVDDIRKETARRKTN